MTTDYKVTELFCIIPYFRNTKISEISDMTKSSNHGVVEIRNIKTGIIK